MRKPTKKQLAERKRQAAVMEASLEIARMNGYHAAKKEMQNELQPTKLKAMQEATALVTACHKLLYSLGLIVNESKGFGK